MAAVSITSLLYFFVGEEKSLKRGENHYKSGHVEAFQYKDGIMVGKVHASMKKNVYDVKVFLNEGGDIKSTECNCPRGQFKCSHAVAIFIHAIHNLSRTDVECAWTKRKATKEDSVASAAEMFPLTRQYSALSVKPTDDDRRNLYAELKKYGQFTGLAWLLSPEPDTTVTLPIVTVEDTLSSPVCVGLATEALKIHHLRESLKVTPEQIKEVSSLTCGQRDVPAWHLLRKGRLTASNFGAVIGAKRMTQSLLKRLLGEYDLSGVKAIQYGITNEDEAINSFTTATNLTVTPSGLWLHESGVLGASPDGLVGDDFVLEVKCPYSHREKTIAEVCDEQNASKFCLRREDDGSYRLRETHPYWHQVQGQMYLTLRNHCYFVVWTTKDSVIVVVDRDPLYHQYMTSLYTFYFDHILPKLLSGDM